MERGKIFHGNYGIGNIIWSVFFFLVLFFHVARHPAHSDGRPTAGAQVLVRVSMVP